MDDTIDQHDASCIAGRYRLGAVLGTGGMSVVHDGFDERLQRPVAIKCLRPEMAARDDVRSRFETEARWAARLTHPHAVAVYDTGEDDGVPFMVMERLPGETLSARIAAGPVDPGWLRGLAVEILGALGAAHECGIVHRDVKPSNILLTSGGHAKVADFGIAKSLGLDNDERLDLTQTGQLVGTPSYLAPERLDGATATAQSDLWAVGIVLYEALAGRKPFVGDDPISVAVAVKHDAPPPLRSLRPDAPDDLVRTIERAMERDPARRWASARDMAAALGPRETSVAGTTVTAPADSTIVGEPSLVDVPAPSRRRSFSPTWLLLPLAVLLIVLLAAFLAARNGDGPSLGAAGTDTGSQQGGDVQLAADLRNVADRVESGDGARGPEAARRLRSIAALVATGKDAGAPATSLLRDAVRWNDDGRQLKDTATSLTVDVLKRVPGVDASAATPVASSGDAPPAADHDATPARGNDTPAKGRGKGKGDRDD